MSEATALKQSFEEARAAHVPIGRVLFEQDGETWIYDFSILSMEQREDARAIYHFGIEITKAPPDSISKLFLSGGHDITLRAFGYLLRKLNADGTVEPFNNERAQGAALKFVRELNAEKHGDRLMQCQEDFFFRAKVADIESIRLLRSYAAAEEGLRISSQHLVKTALNLSRQSLDAAHSALRENSTAASSTKGATAHSSGSSRPKTPRKLTRAGR